MLPTRSRGCDVAAHASPRGENLADPRQVVVPVPVCLRLVGIRALEADQPPDVVDQEPRYPVAYSVVLRTEDAVAPVGQIDALLEKQAVLDQ